MLGVLAAAFAVRELNGGDPFAVAGAVVPSLRLNALSRR